MGDIRRYCHHMASHSDVHLQRIPVGMCRLHFRRTLRRSHSHGNHRYGKHKIWLEEIFTFLLQTQIVLGKNTTRDLKCIYWKNLVFLNQN